MISFLDKIRGNQLPLRYFIDVAKWKLYQKTGRRSRGIFSIRSSRRAIIIHETDSLCLTQIFPFFYYRKEIESRFKVRLSFQAKSDFLAFPERSLRGVPLVILQSWYTTPDDILNSLLHSSKLLNPDAKIVFLDAMSPTDLRLAHHLSDKIDLYVKKHILRDRNQYGKPTRGDTNLTDFYMKQYGISGLETTHPVSANFLNKILIGPSFFTTPRLLGHFKFNLNPDRGDKAIDVHGRMTHAKNDWYGIMRQEAKSKLEQIQGIKIVSEPNVSPTQYLLELRNSKICFSPFGYGEGCHRDYEAVYGGALLLKPDMAHIQTNPDIFIPFKTYVPIDWRFIDLEAKVRHYLHHAVERRELIENAYGVLHRYCHSDYFLDQMKPIFDA